MSTGSVELRRLRLVAEGWIRGVATMRETAKSDRLRRALILAGVELREVERALRAEIVELEAKEAKGEA